MNDRSKRQGEAFGGYALWLGYGTGVFGLFAAVMSLVNFHDGVGAGLALLASAFAFGLITNAIYRQ